MFERSALAIAAIFVCIASSQATADPGGLSPRPTSAGCEMHVWAAPYVQVQIDGWVAKPLEGTGTSYEKSLKRGDSNLIQALLTPELLVAALKESRIGVILGIPSDRFILERDEKALVSFRKLATTNEKVCQYGFDFRILDFLKSPVYGKQITLFYIIVDRSIRPKAKIVSGYESRKISSFDPKASDEQMSLVLKDGIEQIIEDVLTKRYAGKSPLGARWPGRSY